MNLLEVTGLRVRYGAHEAVKGVSFALAPGEILGIVGESGSGKSTVAKALIGLVRPLAGTIALGTKDGLATAGAGQGHPAISVQMIFQDAVGSLNPRMTVRQTMREVVGLSNRRLFGRRASESRAEAVNATVLRLLERVGLSTAVLDQYPRELSGGQCQRVSVARALATRPDVLVADEPVSALDVSVQARVLNLLRDLRRETGLSILLIAHDLAVVKNVCDRVCVMERGRFVDVGETEAVFAHPTSDYTKRLLAAVPRLEAPFGR